MNRLRAGFTLVEMMVIAPIVILLIGSFVALLVNLTGEVMSSRGSNVLAYDVQDALNRIEQDVKLSTTYLSVTNIDIDGDSTANPVVPATRQGYGGTATTGSTVKFTNIAKSGGSNASLILNALATNDNPLSDTANYVYLANAPNTCDTVAEYSKNTPMSMNIVYFVDNNDTLWRRTIMPHNYNTASARCGTAAPWQQPSCTPGYNAASLPFCRTNDIKLVEGVRPVDFQITYYTSAGSTAASGAANNPADTSAAGDAVRNTALQSSPTVSVSIIARKTIAGREISQSGTVRTTRLDTNASSIATQETVTAPPATPNITNVISDGDNVTFTWPRVATATSYSLDYRVNGGAWISGGTAISNNSRSYTVTDGTHTDVVEARVRAANAAGSSAYKTSSITIPLWAPLILRNGWTEYPGHASPAYTKTKAGVVMFKGLIRNGAASIIAQLPEDYRPSGSLIFETSTNQVASRVNITMDGSVTSSAASGAWLALDGIHYMQSSTVQTGFTLSNGWVNYSPGSGGDWAQASYATDSIGRVHTRGLVRAGGTGGGTVIATLPAALNPSEYSHFVNQNADVNGHISINQSGQLVAKGGTNTWLALNTLTYPSAARTTGANCTTNWCNLTLLNSWVYYGSPYTAPQYTKSSDGIVMVKGLIRSGNTGAAIANLPAGFCPKERILMTTIGADVWARVDILPNTNPGTGCQIIPVGVSATWTTLDSVVFIAEQ